VCAARAAVLSARTLAATLQVRYVVGGSLVTMPNDDAETRLQEGAHARFSSRAHTSSLLSIR
jgi:hypothetical protein